MFTNNYRIKSEIKKLLLIKEVKNPVCFYQPKKDYYILAFDYFDPEFNTWHQTFLGDKRKIFSRFTKATYFKSFSDCSECANKLGFDFEVLLAFEIIQVKSDSDFLLPLQKHLLEFTLRQIIL